MKKLEFKLPREIFWGVPLEHHELVWMALCTMRGYHQCQFDDWFENNGLKEDESGDKKKCSSSK